MKPTNAENQWLPASINKWFRLAMFNFLVAATIGALLRYAFVDEIKWLNYKSFQNTHSTMALLGWAYLGFFSLLMVFFGTEKTKDSKFITALFWISEVLILLTAISHIISDNKIVPMIMEGAFSIAALIFVFQFISKTIQEHSGKTSYRFALGGLLFLSLSFIGIYIMIPALIVSGAKKILLYYLGSQFFLHFHYNGWFTFTALSILFKLMEDKKIMPDPKATTLIFYTLLTAVFLTWFISIYWGNQNNLWPLLIASVGGIMQIAIIIMHRYHIADLLHQLRINSGKITGVLVSIALTCLLIKFIMQLIILVPFIANLAFTIRNYVIAYIHLVFIGFISVFMFAAALEKKIINTGDTLYAGIMAFITGFILVELLLIIQGTLLWMGRGFIPFYHLVLFALTLFLPIGLLIIFIKKGKKIITSILT